MRPKSMVLILIALGCGLIASIGISQVMEKNNSGDPPMSTTPIYVAVIDMSAGEELNASKIKLEEWPVDKIPEGAVTSPEQLDGKSPVQPLYAGEPLLMAKLADRDRIQGSAQKIKPGHRVTSINVDAASAVAGLIMPGDHVDVMVFTRGSNPALDKAEAVLEDVEVFAVNDQIHRNYDSEGNSIQARTVSLLVKPEQAERLIYYSQIGVMSLALRSPDDRSSQPSVTAEPAPEPPAPGIGVESLTSLLPDLTQSILPSLTGGGSEFTMEVIEGGSGNVKKYNWDDRGDLPRELRGSRASQDVTGGLPPAVSIDDITPYIQVPAMPAATSGEGPPAGDG